MVVKNLKDDHRSLKQRKRDTCRRKAPARYRKYSKAFRGKISKKVRHKVKRCSKPKPRTEGCLRSRISLIEECANAEMEVRAETYPESDETLATHDAYYLERERDMELELAHADAMYQVEMAQMREWYSDEYEYEY